jgi:hypothetical protein
MKLRLFAAMILIIRSSNVFAQAENIRVIPIGGETARFDVGDFCSFEPKDTPFPDEPLRVRIIRGTRENLVRYGTNRMDIRNACVEYNSIVVRPRITPAGRLDLNFYLDQGFLDGDADGRFMFILEGDDNPRRSSVEYRKLRLAPEQTDTYFDAGKEVTVRAPGGMIRVGRSGGGSPLYANGPGVDCVNLNIDRRPPIIIREAVAEPDTPPESAAGLQ